MGCPYGLNNYEFTKINKMTRDDRRAEEIAKAVLEDTGNAMMSGDFELFASRFLLPQTVETYSGRREITTRDDLFDIFKSVRRQYELIGVTENVRRVISTAFQDDMTITAAHESRLMRGALSIREPYPAYCTLKFVDGRWLITSSVYAVRDMEHIYEGPEFPENSKPEDAE